VFEYPQNKNWQSSDRLLGRARSDFNLLEWDKVNSRLGPSKKVNVIAVGFEADSDSILGQYQEAKWAGGKKNDLVICYGGQPGKAAWVYVFGWTESEGVKRDLESLFIKAEREKEDKDVVLPGMTLLPKMEKLVMEE